MSLEYSPVLRREQHIMASGLLIAQCLQADAEILLDMDGVVVQSDSLNQPAFASEKMRTALTAIGQIGKIGIATARSWPVVKWLQDQGIQLHGSIILEEGHILAHEDNTLSLVRPEYRPFIQNVQTNLTLQVGFKDSWDAVLTSVDQFAFCEGDAQWQGDFRRTWWTTQDRLLDGMTEQVIKDIVLNQAMLAKLEIDKDFVFTLNKMRGNNLAYFSLKGMFSGKTVTKATAGEFLTLPKLFVADGPGDAEFARQTRRNGQVIAIRNTKDLSTDIPLFLDQATEVLESPDELAEAMLYAVKLLYPSHLLNSWYTE